ncbi:hypothetical protein [Nocardia sp. NBC_00403]|uniref:hypothetical protein n=1 Tax=Nocardia sp. NBC_00403 TaxID=2975990 RepID=UPI002E227951
MAIEFHWARISGETDKMTKLTKEMEENTANLKKFGDQLLEEYRGSGATGFEALTSDFNQKIATYQQNVIDLNAKVQANAASGGTMQNLDVKQGNRFRNMSA